MDGKPTQLRADYSAAKKPNRFMLRLAIRDLTDVGAGCPVDSSWRGTVMIKKKCVIAIMTVSILLIAMCSGVRANGSRDLPDQHVLQSGVWIVKHVPYGPWIINLQVQGNVLNGTVKQSAFRRVEPFPLPHILPLSDHLLGPCRPESMMGQLGTTKSISNAIVLTTTAIEP